jgi:DNA (cytosine-5)-methyltransferase 1
MLLLDLFCGAGGAAKGYADAGFEVVGIDIKKQKYFPYDFIEADIFNLTARDLDGFDAVHASPPCQLFSRARLVGTKKNKEAINLIPQTRALLKAWGGPYIIENVERAPLIDPIRLCGSSFGLKVRRHRLFESNVPLTGTACNHKAQGRPVGVYHKMGDQVQGRSNLTGQWVLGGRTASTLEEGQEAMGIDWMPWPQLREALPPAYTKYIGIQLREILNASNPY